MLPRICKCSDSKVAREKNGRLTEKAIGRNRLQIAAHDAEVVSPFIPVMRMTCSKILRLI